MESELHNLTTNFCIPVVFHVLTTLISLKVTLNYEEYAYTWIYIHSTTVLCDRHNTNIVFRVTIRIEVLIEVTVT